MKLAERLDRRFQLSARGSTVAREALAGCTTFAAMSYILVVNPLVLSGAGMDRDGLFLATVLSAMAATLVMALWANLPIALAPGMGTNIVFAQVLVLQMGVPWRTGLAMVLLNALVFLALSLTRWRARIVAAFPEPVKLGMQCAIGVFIAWLGLRSGGLLVADGASLVAFSRLHDGAAWLTLGGVLLTAMLLVLRVPGAFLLTMLTVSALGLFVADAGGRPLTAMPARWFGLPSFTGELLFAPDFRGLASHFMLLLPVTLYFLLIEFFAGTATLFGVMRSAGLLLPDGDLPRARAAFASDALGSVIGAAVGTSTVTAYVESVAGVEAGGRTGLSGVVVAALFGLALFCAPILTVIPACATAPVLVIVGVCMLDGLRELDTSTPENYLPPLLMLLVTACSADLMVALTLGCFAYTLMLLARRRWPGCMMLGLDAVFALYLALRGAIG
ncbi:NCS2 family permease [Duganella vulcania]|uniref:NCS2 family permease n=1 Tax=Duganella vulcania TaxID=2692166 RepID=A0A845GY48_9BURK|nr:NCS2 family permease [Duganella vulcania]MYM98895.1 NCS2 family permease [Duganella vulcania]